jgi:hypothetical protein
MFLVVPREFPSMHPGSVKVGFEGRLLFAALTTGARPVTPSRYSLPQNADPASTFHEKMATFGSALALACADKVGE